MPKTLWTLGHSNVSLEAFLELVQSFDLRALGDVRSFPASRLHPQFNREALAKSLAAHQIDYRWFPGLGGGASRPRRARTARGASRAFAPTPTTWIRPSSSRRSRSFSSGGTSGAPDTSAPSVSGGSATGGSSPTGS